MIVESRENYTLNQLLDLKLKWEDELTNTKERLNKLSNYNKTNTDLYDELIDLEFDLENELEVLNNEIKEEGLKNEL